MRLKKKGGITINMRDFNAKIGTGGEGNTEITDLAKESVLVYLFVTNTLFELH